ncbi:MAG TPA: hypothetical protein PLH97_16485 [Verrucomicrobiota bacterium]|nr:hypothetical protein [Verrucomicrobiota bacterium]
MKRLAFVTGLCLLTGSLRAQVSVDFSLDQEHFLPGEAIRATVRITNRSGQTLYFRTNEHWLSFSMESVAGHPVTGQSDILLDEEVVLPSSKRAVVPDLDLEPRFRLSTPGRYLVTATVWIREWNRVVKSEPKSFDIITGSKLWEQVVGLPIPPGRTNTTPELRRYVLHQANYLKDQLTLYVQIVDSDGSVRRVFPIGRMLSFGQPEPQVDGRSNLHVLYQDDPRSFNYHVIDPDGIILVRQWHDYTTRPRLKADEKGNIYVVGGTRRPTPNDLPARSTAEDNATAQLRP